ncbi:MAG TPA: hypothetical protein V6C85_34775 [Allocoleopsis sp.]
MCAGKREWQFDERHSLAILNVQEKLQTERLCVGAIANAIERYSRPSPSLNASSVSHSFSQIGELISCTTVNNLAYVGWALPNRT